MLFCALSLFILSLSLFLYRFFFAFGLAGTRTPFDGKKECVIPIKTNMNPSDDFIFGPNDYGELNGHCQSCNLHFGFVAELKLHFATIHQRQSFECVVCNKLFLQKFNFLAHIDRVHQPHNQDLGGQNNRDKKNYSCLYCDRFMVLNSQTLQAYIHKEISLICPMCQQPIPSAHSSKKNLALKKLERHPYDCTVCHKSFKSPSSLAFHNKSSLQVSNCRHLVSLKRLQTLISKLLAQLHEKMNFQYHIIVNTYLLILPRILCINAQLVENLFQDLQMLRDT